ncbi:MULTISPECIES: MATE family efflux transporter [Pseudoalteromonas]|jgi:putative MATE family efflux protein|uniref:MATE family efflux transporter n=1 Tax=Pseudoalteromonas TaxID=53246 RepID=UPI001E4F6A2F|nr:MATE family efflux transporter [Pseudoalteromonas sp. 1_2015MBL_MicDiv]
MHDLTRGSIPKHLIKMAIPMMIGMIIQTLYFLVDLYFVGNLGGNALAGLSLAGNAMFLIFALTQILNVGTTALISHAAGRKDAKDANAVFNQSMMLASLMALVVMFLGYLGSDTYLTSISTDLATIEAGQRYLHWFLPGMALQFPLVAVSAALRGAGIVKPTMLIQTLSIIVNIILSPILIIGWGTDFPMGIAGAGLASTISVVVAVVMLCVYFVKAEKFVTFKVSLWRVDSAIIKRLLGIGLPAGGEFFLMFAYMGLIYWLIQHFGPEAQAGFGLGSRIMQSLFLPAMAIAFAAPAVAGQNFGAKQFDRVRETFFWSALMTCSLMAVLSVVCFFIPELLVQGFSDDQNVILVAATFLQIICINFIPTGIVFTCSGLFQSLGNTLPSLYSTTLRIILFVLPALLLSQMDGFNLTQLWYLSASTVVVQAVISFMLLRREFRYRLPKSEPIDERLVILK